MKLKTKKIPLFLYFVFLIYIQLFAQEDQVELIGIVKQDSILLNNINIINKTTNYGTSSDLNGKFKIFAKEGDSIVISSLIHKNRAVVISKSHINSKYLIIYLESEFNELNEVFLSNKYILDIGNVSVDKGTILDSKEGELIAPPVLDNKYKNTNGIGFVSVFNALTKKARLKRNEIKRENEKNLILKKEFSNKIITLYESSFFTEILHIPKDEIYLFLDFSEDKGLLELFNKNDFLVKDFLIKQAILFNKIKN